MANPEHLAKLKEGPAEWNSWRAKNAEVEPDLQHTVLSGVDFIVWGVDACISHVANLSNARLNSSFLQSADLQYVDFRGANLYNAHFSESNLANAKLCGANLSDAYFCDAKLSRANLSAASLVKANLRGANLTQTELARSDLSGAILRDADLTEADFSEANLSGADLSRATLIGTNLVGANLTACHVFGISAWDVKLEGAIQSNLVITAPNEPSIQVDNLEVAQFIYLLLNNQKIRSVIDTITSKVVLILGRFTPERKVVLDAIRDELRKRDYLPVLFDFEKPAGKDLTGTISTLANMARFVIADLTDPSSVPHELATLVPNTVVPVQTIILEGQREYAMFPDLKKRYHWVLEPHQYKSQKLLIAHLGETVIAPAEAKAKELSRK